MRLDHSPVTALNGELELFRSIADYTPAILWVTDPDGNRVELWQPPAGQ